MLIQTSSLLHGATTFQVGLIFLKVRKDEDTIRTIKRFPAIQDLSSYPNKSNNNHKQRGVSGALNEGFGEGGVLCCALFVQYAYLTVPYPLLSFPAVRAS